MRSVIVALLSTLRAALRVPQTGYGFNAGARRGIRIGSARDGSVKYLIPDPCPYPYARMSSLAEGVTIDTEGNV
jgi:hypothetical protein